MFIIIIISLLDGTSVDVPMGSWSRDNTVFFGDGNHARKVGVRSFVSKVDFVGGRNVFLVRVSWQFQLETKLVNSPR